MNDRVKRRFEEYWEEGSWSIINKNVNVIIIENWYEIYHYENWWPTYVCESLFPRMNRIWIIQIKTTLLNNPIKLAFH